MRLYEAILDWAKSLTIVRVFQSNREAQQQLELTLNGCGAPTPDGAGQIRDLLAAIEADRPARQRRRR
ncbi:MAG: hypothetical protein R8L07_03355 [Alphaproteobacteria bacterium]|nr:hypothetical protein [Alphaproteobacteria bacterium]